MAESARIKITWTTSTNAVSYKVYRSDSSNGPWVLKATVAPYVGTWYDMDVDPSPFRTYYYQVETTCSNGSTSIISGDDICQNCPTENQASIFALRDTVYNTETTSEGPVPGTSQVQYYDALYDYLNTNYNASKTVTQNSIAVYNDGSGSGEGRALFCHKCGKDIVDLKPNSPKAETSYMKVSSMASLLPTPHSAFGGSSLPQASIFTVPVNYWGYEWNLGTYVARKATSADALVSGGYSDRIVFGINANDGSYNYMVPYLGGSVYLDNTPSWQRMSNYPSNSAFASRTYVNYNLGGAPMVDASGNQLYDSSGNQIWHRFKSIQLPKYANPIIDTSYHSYQNFSSALELIPSGGSSNWHIAIIDGDAWTSNPNNPYSKCSLYVYNIFRVPDFDGFDSNGNRVSYGFSLAAWTTNAGWLDTSNSSYTIGYNARTQNTYFNGDWADMIYDPANYRYDGNLLIIKFFQR